MPNPNDPTYLYPWMTQGQMRFDVERIRQQMAEGRSLPRSLPPSWARYYLPTITRPRAPTYPEVERIRQQMAEGRSLPRSLTGPRAPTYPEVPWSSQPLFTGGIPNSYYNPPPQPGMPAPTHSGGLFDQQALTHGGGVLDAQALAQAQAGTQGQAGTAPHGLVQVWNLANRLLGQARQYAPPDTTAAGGGGGDGGGGGGAGPGGGGRGTVPAPAGIDVDWYAEFQRQHGGQTPEQYYARTGETLAHAMADEEWARGFAEMYGRPPTDDDWRAHWFSSRVGYTPEEYERWKMRQIARQEIRRTPPAKEKQPEQRPPVYQPPFITWR